MRITNKVMQNNSLRNVNNNKVLQDKLNTQIATGKKVDKPSDDPVVAIRSLRLRSDVSQIDQYLNKNIEDASSWLQLTESSAKQTIAAVTNMIEQCETGASDQYTVKDKLIMVDSLRELKNEVYRTGDADYAGRYIFTGYRTNTSLSFGNEAKNQKYTISQSFSFEDLETMTYVDTGNLMDITKANFESHTGDVVENNMKSMTYYRFRLGYDDLDSTMSGQAELIASLRNLNLKDASGNPLAISPRLETDSGAAYTAAAAASEPGSANPLYLSVIPSTGEVVMSKEVYDAINNAKNADGTHQTLYVDYNKTKWQNSDLRPEHYYYCRTVVPDSSVPGGQKTVEYNKEYRDTGVWNQPIEYKVGFNQSVQVNSYAADIYATAIGRDIDEITDLADKLTGVLDQVDMLKSMKEDTVNYGSQAQQAAIDTELDAASKAQTYLTDLLQRTFSKYITKMQGYLDTANESITEMGNRGKQLDLIKNRLSDQQTTFKELQSDNEDADITEVAVQLSSAQVSYEAALMATSKMIQTTLLNYL